jgi:hypothetical protein
MLKSDDVYDKLRAVMSIRKILIGEEDATVS